MNKVKVFAPATIANIGPGYDIFGLALENIGDFLEMEHTDNNQITIAPVEEFPELPTAAEKNIAGIVASHMLTKLKIDMGLHIKINKNVKPGSGLGSSGSSAAAAAFALNELLDRPFTQMQLIEFAMMGEKSISGKAHADNVAASILGGFTVVKGYNPLQVFNIPFPEHLHIAIVHPLIEVKTADSKKVLKKELILEDVVKQCGNIAGLVAGMTQGNYELIGDSMQDLIAEPIRSFLIPGYRQAKALALENGAIGSSISGSGPSIFAFTKGKEKAELIASIWENYYNNLDIPNHTFCSAINPIGCVVID
jgi:homoserine kinase